MFAIGDRVVYPMHGAGIIESIEEREVLGEIQSYFVMKLPLGEMKVMIPTKNVEDLGIRGVISHDEVDRVLEILHSESSLMSSNWNHRYRANLEKIKSGDIYEVAEVVRNLTLRDKEKGLSAGERKMLDTSRQILMSELVLAQNINQDQVSSMIDSIIG